MPCNIAKKVLRLESKAVGALVQRVDQNFERAIKMLLRTKGRVVVVGMGKPGIIAQKISASLASTGTPSIALHPADAAHGDLGRVTRDDILITLSKSGETEEILRLLPIIRHIGCRMIAMVGNKESHLAKVSNIVLDISVKREADPLDVAPTASTTCMLAMGDALVMALVHKKGFRKKDFAMFHPGGSLGKTLHLKVKNVMRQGKFNPKVKPHTTVKETLFKITSARSGAACIVDGAGKSVGIFTDGDLRRRFKEMRENMSRPISDFMTRNPTSIGEEELASEALEMMKKKMIDELPVVNKKGRIVGMLDVQDLIKEGFLL